MSIYDFTAVKDNGESYSLKEYEGQVLIIVNTATKCGLAPQFKELEELYQQYKDQGLVILGFPSNQFHQEVSDSKEASHACQLTYGVSFPMHEITDVNGEDANPIFKYLTTQTNGVLGSKIKWNFTKFLIDRNGHVVKRFAPIDKPSKMRPEIECLLEK